MLGVSAAYFISRFAETFTPSDIALSLKDIAAIGGESYQSELFSEEGILAWTEQAITQLQEAEARASVRASQFMAHYFLHGFSNPASLQSDRGFAPFSRIIEICTRFPSISTITIPLPPFDAGKTTRPSDWVRLKVALIEKLRRPCGMAAEKELQIALELVPGNILGSPEMIMALRQEKGLERLGYNYDTGHAWACRERVDLLPAKMQGAIYGTHLKDNKQEGALALAPGKGSIDWERVLGGLIAAGYSGSWDVELICTPEQVQSEHADGIALIRKCLRSCGVIH
ncbi:hypothetical protein MASR2M78_29480 [Treponema sp.]